ncbi:MAG: hypothetical protein WCK97_04395 [Actinomycetes bacterium]
MSDEQPGDVRDTLSGLEQRLREIEGDLRSGAAEPKAAAGNQDSGGPGNNGPRKRPSGLLTAGLGAAAVLALVLIAVIASSSGNAPNSTAGSSQLVLAAGVANSDGALVISKLSGVRAARGDAAAEACAGTAGAALVIVQPAPRTVGCAGLQQLLTMTVSATAIAERGGSRRCLSAAQVTSRLRRPASRLTRQRASHVLKARQDAAMKAKTAGASAAASLNAQRRAAAVSGAKFDSVNHLSLAKVRNATGACVAPSDVALRSGAYPLSLRVALLARPDSALNANVTEAEAKLRIALSGAVPVEAAVAGR